MTHVSRATLIMVLMGWLAPAWAGPPDGMGGPGMMESGPPPGPPAFLKQVFPPKLVMEHQQEIGLRPAQVDVIKQAMREAQQQLVDLQWRLDAESEALGKLLAADHVDEAAEIMSVSVEALESLLARGRRALRARLGAIAPALLREG